MSTTPLMLILLLIIGFLMFQRARYTFRALIPYLLIAVVIIALIDPHLIRIVLGELLYWINWLFWQLGVRSR